MKPLISIIIPTFNSGKTLEFALESIVSQTYEDFEVLILDGLSEDNTLEIAKGFKNKINRLFIYSEKDKGIYDAMNKGIDLAKGDWMYFMGSDDSLYKNTTLEKISTIAAINNFDVIYGSVISPRFGRVYDGEFNYIKLTNQNICHQAIFFNKSVFKKTGKFNLKYKAHADWDHNIKWFFSSKVSSFFINEIIANYADGGFSSITEDKEFKKDKLMILIKRGLRVLPIKQQLKLIKRMIYERFIY